MGSGQTRLTGAYYAGVGRGTAYEDDLFFSHVLSGGNVRAVAAVADGMGEGLGGLRAAQTATGMIKSLLVARIHSLRDRKFSELELSELLKESMQKANARLLRMASETPMGATLTAMVFTDGFAVLGHVGDCRAYRLQEGRLKQLTEDHAVGIALTRRLGKDPAMQIDLSVEQIRDGQIFVICSNGLHSRVGDAEIAESLDQTENLNQACVDLVNLAMERGGPEADCASAIVLECGRYIRKPAAQPLPTQEPAALAQDGPAPGAHHPGSAPARPGPTGPPAVHGPPEKTGPAQTRAFKGQGGGQGAPAQIQTGQAQPQTGPDHWRFLGRPGPVGPDHRRADDRPARRSGFINQQRTRHIQQAGGKPHRTGHSGRGRLVVAQQGSFGQAAPGI